MLTYGKETRLCVYSECVYMGCICVDGMIAVSGTKSPVSPLRPGSPLRP